MITTTEGIGFLAAFCTTMAFVPQLVKAWRTKETKDLSLTMLCVLNLGVFLWLIYGLYIHSVPVIIANAVTLIFAAAILVLKVKYQ